MPRKALGDRPATQETDMNQFRQDNTEGFTDAQLAAMNDEFYHNLQVIDLPYGVEGASDDLLEQIKQSTAEAVLKRHGAA